MWMLLLAAAGACLTVYCTLDSVTMSLDSVAVVKNPVVTELTNSDQVALFSVHAVPLLFLPVMVGLSWTRVDHLTSVCDKFVTNGYRVGDVAKASMVASFAVRATYIDRSIHLFKGGVVYVWLL